MCHFSWFLTCFQIRSRLVLSVVGIWYHKANKNNVDATDRVSHFPSDLSSPSQEKHISSDMCSPPPEKHIPSDMCSPTLEKHIPSDLSSPTQETHIPSDMSSPSQETHISSGMCSPTQETHIPNVLNVVCCNYDLFRYVVKVFFLVQCQWKRGACYMCRHRICYNISTKESCLKLAVRKAFLILLQCLNCTRANNTMQLKKWSVIVIKNPTVK